MFDPIPMEEWRKEQKEHQEDEKRNEKLKTTIQEAEKVIQDLVQKGKAIPITSNEDARTKIHEIRNSRKYSRFNGHKLCTMWNIHDSSSEP